MGIARIPQTDHLFVYHGYLPGNSDRHRSAVPCPNPSSRATLPRRPAPPVGRYARPAPASARTTRSGTVEILAPTTQVRMRRSVASRQIAAAVLPGGRRTEKPPKRALGSGEGGGAPPSPPRVKRLRPEHVAHGGRARVETGAPLGESVRYRGIFEGHEPRAGATGVGSAAEAGRRRPIVAGRRARLAGSLSSSRTRSSPVRNTVVTEDEKQLRVVSRVLPRLVSSLTGTPWEAVDADTLRRVALHNAALASRAAAEDTVGLTTPHDTSGRRSSGSHANSWAELYRRVKAARQRGGGVAVDPELDRVDRALTSPPRPSVRQSGGRGSGAKRSRGRNAGWRFVSAVKGSRDVDNVSEGLRFIERRPMISQVSPPRPRGRVDARSRITQLRNDVSTAAGSAPDPDRAGGSTGERRSSARGRLKRFRKRVQPAAGDTRIRSPLVPADEDSRRRRPYVPPSPPSNVAGAGSIGVRRVDAAGDAMLQDGRQPSSDDVKLVGGSVDERTAAESGSAVGRLKPDEALASVTSSAGLLHVESDSDNDILVSAISAADAPAAVAVRIGSDAADMVGTSSDSVPPSRWRTSPTAGDRVGFAALQLISRASPSPDRSRPSQGSAPPVNGRSTTAANGDKPAQSPPPAVRSGAEALLARTPSSVETPAATAGERAVHAPGRAAGRRRLMRSTRRNEEHPTCSLSFIGSNAKRGSHKRRQREHLRERTGGGSQLLALASALHPEDNPPASRQSHAAESDFSSSSTEEGEWGSERSTPESRKRVRREGSRVKRTRRKLEQPESHSWIV